ncbi:DUF6807 domain-containing protein [Cryptosporangium minutisporangium]|uniref:DUF6807 domain-containing protein n=1 Tax=Cryptosporangium minutisporangium TaxID=113569 RepID=UPI0031EA22BD
MTGPSGRVAAGDGEDRPLSVGGREVARHVHRPELEPYVAPRPYLHPVRTLGGTPVTDAAPVDHRWHLGCSVAIQDVAGTNIWGGRTYRREDGYQDRDDRGSVRHRDFLVDEPDHVVTAHDWIARDGRVVLTEERDVRAAPGDGHWVLDVGFALRVAGSEPVELGSPGTNGRADAGYGGFFWRLPASAAALEVRSAHGQGEEGTHGRPSPWLAVTADAGSPSSGYTLVFLPGDAATAADPWFVRVAAYPGVGSALAYTDPVTLVPGEALARRVRVLVADGRRSPSEIKALAEAEASDGIAGPVSGWGGRA